MKAVVTGGAGFIGSNLSDGWANRNAEVIHYPYDLSVDSMELNYLSE
ncbi:MAG TPA: NAD-dependent epimerase/dehydratase family protein [Candidatus Bathyarchaeia archaeon]|nr:NAD-dependent epimerase/dehydratase family protein [Candidatus Bathyarchaeia archaeon]